MKGLQFVRRDHLYVAEGCYLPRADLLGYIDERLHDVLVRHPGLKQYIPNLIDVDVFVTWDADRFILFVSPEKRFHLPTRGMETKHMGDQRAKGFDFFAGIDGFQDLSHSTLAEQAFEQVGFARGFAATGVFPSGAYAAEDVRAKENAGEQIALLIERWALQRKHMIENAKIFLSHRGINKPLVEKIDQALKSLNLQTWFDRNDLAAGDTLMRGVDGAFANCVAAVFFISSDYADAGVIGKEIDRAIHEAATRKEGFRVIPLVLAQHGGSDANVPAPLRTLVWKTVDDVDIVPAILKAIPQSLQRQVRYAH